MATPVLYIDGKPLDMGGITAITMERANPLLSERQQSYSYPFVLPCTPHNDRLLGFPARYTRAGRTQRSQPCTMVCGSKVRVGRLVLNNIPARGYDASMTYDTADLLSGIADKKLVELHDKKYCWKALEYGSVDIAIAAMERLYNGEDNSEICIFPVVVDSSANENSSGKNIVLNDVDVSTRKLKGLSSDYVDGKFVNVVPKGFGIAPFLRVKYVLECIFGHQGYTLDLQQRAVQPIEQLVVLHNNVDVIVNGYVQYKHLLPDCTVSDFVSTIEKMFCGKFVLSSKTGIVTFVYFNDYLDSEGRRDNLPQPWMPYPDTRVAGLYRKPVMELLPYSVAPPSQELLPISTIMLSMSKGLTLDKRGKGFCVETKEDFFTEELEEVCMASDFENLFSGRPPIEVIDIGVIIYKELFSPENDNNTWNYYRPVQGGSQVDNSMLCEHLPMSSISPNFFWEDLCPCYGFGSSYANSIIAQKTPKEKKTPLAFACSYTLQENSLRYTCGTTLGRPAESIIPLRLHRPDGLFNVYHGLRDEMLRSGGYRITVPIDPSVQIDEMELYLYNGQLCMVERVIETQGAATKQEVVLRTIKKYE